MPKRSTTLHREFTDKIRVLNGTRASFEDAHSMHSISDTDIVQAYAGLYLDLFTEFEALIESLFIGLLEGSVKHSDTAVLRKIRIKPATEIESVLQGEKRTYLDWLPYPENSISRAKIYFDDGRPFTKLETLEKQKIATYHKIRNAIAHKGKKADGEFRIIIGGLTLSPVEQSPSGYLRNIPNPTSGFTQLEIIANELTAISHKLCF
jgi:hypothetical protein